MGEMADAQGPQLPVTRNLHESLTRAEDYAIKRKHTVVGLDHLLLALAEDVDAASWLIECKVDLRELCSDLLRNLGPEARNLNPNPIPPNIDITVQNLIAHASADALEANQEAVSGANIIAAILSGEGGMITQKLFLRHGLSSEEVSQKLKKPTAKKPESVVTTHQDESKDKPKTGESDLKDQTESAELSEALGGDELLNAERPLVDSEIVEDTIIQAEAHPSDYGTGPDSEADHPVPPEQHTANGQHGKKNVAALKSGLKQTAPDQALTQTKNPIEQSGTKNEFGNNRESKQDPKIEQFADHHQAKGVDPPPKSGDGTQPIYDNLVAPINDDQVAELGGQSRAIQESHRDIDMSDAQPGAHLNGKNHIPPPPKDPNQRPLNVMPPPQNMEAPAATAHLPNAGSTPPMPRSQMGKTPVPVQMREGNPIPAGLRNPAPPQHINKNVPPAGYGTGGDPSQKPMNEIANSIQSQRPTGEGLNDQVLTNIPKVMRLGKTHFVEVQVARFTNAELESGPENYGLRARGDNTPITKAITVRLTGPDGQFLIDSITPSTQWSEYHASLVEDADFAIWRWRIFPLRQGRSKLRLDVTMRTSNENGLTGEIPVQPSEAYEIKVTRNYGRIAKRIAVAILLIALGFGAAMYGQNAYQYAKKEITKFSTNNLP